MASDVDVIEDEDEEWQLMLAEFNQHFWMTRAPAFAQAWAACSPLAPELWGEELKRSVHGLAGVAALVGQGDLGDLARQIERCWDHEGANQQLRADLQLLADRLAAARQDQAAQDGNG